VHPLQNRPLLFLQGRREDRKIRHRGDAEALNLMTSQYLKQEFFPKQEEKFITKARKDEVTKSIFFFVLSNFRVFVIAFGFFLWRPFTKKCYTHQSPFWSPAS
jgi:putative SOS response-associated peptidase YedK